MATEILFSPIVFLDEQKMFFTLRLNDVVITDSLWEKLTNGRKALQSFCDSLWTKKVFFVGLMRVLFNSSTNDFYALLRIETTTSSVEEYSTIHLFNLNKDGNCEITDETFDEDHPLLFHMDITNDILETKGVLLFK